VSEERLTRFGRALRAEGLPVGTGRVAEFCRAAALLPPDDLYWAGRATLVARAADIPVYDAAFEAFFGPPAEARQQRVVVRVRVEGEAETALASPIELLREKSFARCSEAELAELGRMMRRLPLVVPKRRTRRRDPARKGSPYSRALVMFAHGALRSGRRVEAFCFGTRLTRVTRSLAAADADAALAHAAAEVVDWDGGTRIGESLKAFLDEHGHGGLARGALVLICSDGLEVGDPDLLAAQMARLARLAYRVVWLNPLQEDPAYEPLARGMKAALPHVDLFASGHSLASLEELSAALERL
jgi:uncharacterized protein with von Willebrand factor type A (vWA) domain